MPMLRRPGAAFALVALLFALVGCDREVVQPTPVTTSTPPTTSTPATPSRTPTPTATPYPSFTPLSREAGRAADIYRRFADLRWRYLTDYNGLGPTEKPRRELTNLVTGDALTGEVAALRAWRADGSSVKSGRPEILWIKDLNNALTSGQSVAVLQVCTDASSVITTNAAGNATGDSIAVSTVFFTRVDEVLKIHYIDRTLVSARGPCGPAARPTPSPAR